MSGGFDVPPKDFHGFMASRPPTLVGDPVAFAQTGPKSPVLHSLPSVLVVFSIDMSVSGSVTPCRKDLSDNDPPFLIFFF